MYCTIYNTKESVPCVVWYGMSCDVLYCAVGSEDVAFYPCTIYITAYVTKGSDSDHVTSDIYKYILRVLRGWCTRIWWCW